jgi:hypothetical protein
MTVDIDGALAKLGAEVRRRFRAGAEIALEGMVDDMDDDDETLLDAVEDRMEILMDFEWIIDASPMTATSSSALAVLDLPGDTLLLVAPGDWLIDVPMEVFAELPRGDREAVHRAAADQLGVALAEGESPLHPAGLPEQIRLGDGDPVAELADRLTGWVDAGADARHRMSEVVRILSRDEVRLPDAPTPDLVAAYIDVVVRRV